MRNSKLEYGWEEQKKIHKCKAAAVHPKGLQQRCGATFLITPNGLPEMEAGEKPGQPHNKQMAAWEPQGSVS